jgi:hypothetical protein
MEKGFATPLASYLAPNPGQSLSSRSKALAVSEEVSSLKLVPSSLIDLGVDIRKDVIDQWWRRFD